jgi:outer membrane protein assembly factor BamD
VRCLRLAAGLMGIVFLPGCMIFHFHRHANVSLPVNPNEQPDRILYEKSMAEIQHGRYTVGRLTLQTLLNTYPDSEYLAKAKLAIADSYYRQGGVSGLTQAQAEYSDFITFFPDAPEAPMAQYRAAMSYFRLMNKPDRDLTDAKLAELELEKFLLKYPRSPLLPKVEARLREVQEVVAEGDFETAKFYYDHHANPAALSRFRSIVNRYPNFSKADVACWDLAQTLVQQKKPREAVPYYDRILTLYPLSPLARRAKERLAALDEPIPQPTKAEMARAKADAVDIAHHGMLSRLGRAFQSSPDLSRTRHGPVILGSTSASIEIAKTPTSAGAGNTIAVRPAGSNALRSGGTSDPTAQQAEGSSASSTAAKEQTRTPPVKPKKHRSLFKHLIKPW